MVTDRIIQDIDNFRRQLIIWGEKNFRAFPWRQSEDPYLILMAEIMLHRTQVRQVVPVYRAFVEQYPNIEALISADEAELQSLLYPLGLHWRTKLIRDMARKIATDFGCQIPHDRRDLLSLPGVSDYIASAVRCFAWNIAEPLVDTNTVRVTGRLFGLEIKDSSRRNSHFRNRISGLVPSDNPRGFNYAMLDLAHLVCTGKQLPACDQCPVCVHCVYGNHGLND